LTDQLPLMTDTPPILDTAKSQRFQPLAELVHALGFLTRLPVPFLRTIDPPPLSQTMRMFSIVGALIGLLIGLALLGFARLHVPPILAGILAIAAGCLLTGALHEDGLADFVDGVGGGKTRERRLEIMRDSRIGTYGALALIVVLSLRVFATVALLALPATTILLIMAAVGAFSRAMVVDLLWATQTARNDGLSVLAGRPSRNVAVFAIVIGLGLTFLTALVIRPEAAVIALGVGLAVTAIIRHLAIKKLGGQTGDVCGAVQVACETAMLVVFASTIG
jgi:adenosylcobinamide-GDP ribazoletransferase